MLTPASTGAGDPDFQAYAHGAWLSWGAVGSQPGVMELISAVVNDLYDGSGVQRLQLSLQKADYEEMALAAWSSSEEPPRSADDFQAVLWKGLQGLQALTTLCSHRAAGMGLRVAVMTSRSNARSAARWGLSSHGLCSAWILAGT